MDGSGAMTDTYDYDGFGNLIGRRGTTQNDFTYRGEQMDTTLGWQHLGARWIDPAKGRFATRDGFEGFRALPESLSPYSYAFGNPIDREDPSGHFAEGGLTESMGTLAIYGTLVGIATTSLQVAVAPGRAYTGPSTTALGERSQGLRKDANLDANTLQTLSTIRPAAIPTQIELNLFLFGRRLFVTQTASDEFVIGVLRYANTGEYFKAVLWLGQAAEIPDDPSDRALALRRTRTVKDKDIIVFGTGDKYGLITVSGDQKFYNAALAQGVDFDVFLHRPYNFLAAP
jgi:RHS repeat-associated protein